jgi:hypothetical protein
MPKPLSEQLAELSVRAKHAEDALAAVKKEAHDKVVARKERARAAATAAAELGALFRELWPVDDAQHNL